MISTKPVPLNAHSLIRDNLDPDSNDSDVSDPHRRKQFSPKTSTDAGIMIPTKPLSLSA
jgi:hypothetical protein